MAQEVSLAVEEIEIVLQKMAQEVFPAVEVLRKMALKASLSEKIETARQEMVRKVSLVEKRKMARKVSQTDVQKMALQKLAQSVFQTNQRRKKSIDLSTID